MGARVGEEKSQVQPLRSARAGGLAHGAVHRGLGARGGSGRILIRRNSRRSGALPSSPQRKRTACRRRCSTAARRWAGSMSALLTRARSTSGALSARTRICRVRVSWRAAGATNGSRGTCGTGGSANRLRRRGAALPHRRARRPAGASGRVRGADGDVPALLTRAHFRGKIRLSNH